MPPSLDWPLFSAGSATTVIVPRSRILGGWPALDESDFRRCLEASKAHPPNNCREPQRHEGCPVLGFQRAGLGFAVSFKRLPKKTKSPDSCVRAQISELVAGVRFELTTFGL